MKPKRIFILISALFFFACKKNSTSPIAPPQAPIGEVNVKIGDSTSGSILTQGVFKTQDNNFIISGTKWLYDGTVGHLNFFPMRISINSAVVVKSSIAPLIYEYGSAIQSIKSNNFIYTVVNTEDPLTNSFTGVKVIKTDSSNNLIWNKPISDLTQATSLILLANGDILMLGNRGSDLTGTNNTMVIVKLNSDGNTIFRKDYTGQFFYSSTEILEEPANYTLVAYKVVNQPHYFQTLHPSLIKIDFSGNIISATQLDSLMAGSAHYYNSFHLKKNKPGGYLLTTTYTDIIDPTVGGVTNEYFNLKILNPDGSIAKSVDLTAAGNHKAVFQISDAIQTLNGNVYVLVCCKGGSTGWYTEILKFDSGGNYQNYKDMLPGKFPVALSEGENNNIMMFLDNSAGNSITILKLNSNFEVL